MGARGRRRSSRDLGAIEITVTAASGGRGRVWIDELALDVLPPPGAAPAPLAEWRSAPGSGEEQTVRLDLGGRREIGGISLFWDADDYARLYDVEMSDDGTRWRLARSIKGGRGGRAWIFLPDTDAAFVRLRLHESARGRGYALRQLRAEPPEIADSPTKFLEAVAKEAPRGRWPRSLVGEQIYWTLVGVDGGSEKGLLSEDGALETGRGEYSVEPFLRAGGRFLGWAEASQIEHSLEEGDLPIPSVRRTYAGGLSLTVTAYADGSPDSSTMHARYRVENSGPAPVTAALYLALRPVQVNPPWQFLSTQGGAAPIRQVRWDADRRAVVVEDAHAGRGFDPRDRVRRLELRRGRDRRATRRGRHAEVGAMPPIPTGSPPPRWRSTSRFLREARSDVIIAVPLSASATSGTPASFEEGLSAAARDWRAKLSRVVVTVPPEAEPVARAARSNLAWILINREGPRIRPGSRSYARSWIRDGSLTSVALMRLGHAEDAGAFLRWFAPYQFESGMVPCCVDAPRRGPRARERQPRRAHLPRGVVLPATRATALLWRPSGRTSSKAADYIDALRRQRRTDEYRTGEKRLYFGLLPESISHEGYSSQPVHSYWDDFFGIRGLADAAWLARALGKADEARRFAASEAEMRADVLASIRAVIAEKKLDFIPGSADLGDFDATSTTIALDPGEEQSRLPAVELARTFEIYWERFQKRAVEPARRRQRVHALRVARRGTRSSGSADATGRRPSSTSSWPTAARPAGTTGPRSSGTSRACRSSSATCRTAGSARTSCARSWISSPTRAPADPWSSAPAFPPSWLRACGRRRGPGAAHALRHARPLRCAGGRRRAVPDRRDGEAAGRLRRGLAAGGPAHPTSSSTAAPSRAHCPAA